MSRIRGIAIAAVITGLMVTGVLLGALTAHYYEGTPPSPPAEARVLWPDPKPIQAFSLSDHSGREFDLGRLQGKWSFLFFGYTNCPDVCPVTLAVLDRVEQALGEQGIEDVQTLFISVDPRRDTRERLAGYVNGFNPDFIGLRGSAGEVRSLSNQLGVAVPDHPHGSAGPDYLVDHSSAVFLTDPRGRLISLFSPPYGVDQIVTRYLQIRRFINARS